MPLTCARDELDGELHGVVDVGWERKELELNFWKKHETCALIGGLDMIVDIDTGRLHFKCDLDTHPRSFTRETRSHGGVYQWCVCRSLALADAC